MRGHSIFRPFNTHKTGTQNPQNFQIPNTENTKLKCSQGYDSHFGPTLYPHKLNYTAVAGADPMGREKKFSWGSALVGAAAASATALVLSAKPRDPTFHLISIDLTSFKLSFPALDAETILTVHVTNPNVAPIRYSNTAMSIYYAGSLLGSAPVEAGSQPARSCQLLRLPARLSGLQLAQHAKEFLGDVARREMVLDSSVEISGTAKALWWNHGFKVRVDSRVIVDPVYLDVIDQENRSKLEMFVDS